MYEPKEVRDKRKKGDSYSIGIFTGKGGQGKSTLSLLLAAYYANQGLKVAVIDLDGRTAINFAKQRRERSTVQFSVFDASQLAYALNKYDRVIVDSPGNDRSKQTLEAVFSLDAVMIPCEPDLESLRNAIVASNLAYKDRSQYLATTAAKVLKYLKDKETVKNGAIKDLDEAVTLFNKPANWFVVFNNVTERGKVAEFRQQLQRFETPVIETVVPTLDKIADYISVGELPHDHSSISDDAFSLVKTINEVCHDINSYVVNSLERQE